MGKHDGNKHEGDGRSENGYDPSKTVDPSKQGGKHDGGSGKDGGKV